MQGSSSAPPTRLARRTALIGAAGAVAFSIAIGWRNYFVYRAAGREVPLWECIAGELPIWLGWLALAPLIVRLARRWPPIGTHAVRHGLFHTAAALALSAVMSAFILLALTPLPSTPTPLTTELGFGAFWVQIYITVVFSFLFVYGSILGLALAWIYYVEQQQRQLRESRLEALLVQSQRDLLRTQLHPHFLFNTMHAISALMNSDVGAARQMMIRLGDLLRRTLDDGAGHEVTLQEELELLGRYLDIQLVRFQDRLRVEYDVAESLMPLLVPRLVLQPIAENAITHGLAPVERPVTIRIRAERVVDELVITVADDGAGLPQSLRHGVGIGNSEARLRQLYGEAGRLTLTPALQGAVTTIRLPAHTTPIGTLPANGRTDHH